MADQKKGSRGKERTPSWLRRRVRARMEQTGEKYTTALRAVQAEMAANKEKYGEEKNSGAEDDVSGV